LFCVVGDDLIEIFKKKGRWWLSKFGISGCLRIRIFQWLWMKPSRNCLVLSDFLVCFESFSMVDSVVIMSPDIFVVVGLGIPVLVHKICFKPESTYKTG